MNGRLAVLSISLVLVWTPAARAQAGRETAVNPVCSQLLSAAEVGRLSRRSGVDLVPRLSIKGATGTCNYAEDGEQVLLVITLPAPPKGARDPFLVYQKQPAYLRNQREIGRLGDAAFSSGDFDQTVVVKKGDRIVVVSAALDLDRTSRTIHGAYFTGQQVRQLARTVVDRLR